MVSGRIDTNPKRLGVCCRNDLSGDLLWACGMPSIREIQYGMQKPMLISLSYLIRSLQKQDPMKVQVFGA
jgi:hypothetical protein